MRCSNQLLRSKALVSRAAASASGAARAKASMSTIPTPSPGDAANAARTATSTSASEIRALVDSLARSDPAEDVLRLAVVGDVHGSWSTADAVALGALGADAVCLVGDFGNESTSVVEALSFDLRRAGLPFAAILGNHDAWYSMTKRGRKRAEERDAAAAGGGGGSVESEVDDGNGAAGFSVPAASSPGIAKQLRSLGRSHVGYSWRAFEDLSEGDGPGDSESSRPRLAVAGARPFSMGGPDLSRSLPFYSEMYDVGSFEDSAEKIAGSLRDAAAHLGSVGGGSGAALVLLGHNGPAGLGDAKHDACGADFLDDGGDWGDPDLEEALRIVESEERYAVVSGDDDDDDGTRRATTAASSPRRSCAVPSLVAFGHMHRSLRHASSPLRQRNAVEVCPRTGLVYLNAAAWPRAREAGGSGGGILQRRVDGAVVGSGGDESPPPAGSTVRHAVLVEVDKGVVTSVADAWVTVSPRAEGSGDGEEEEKRRKREARLEATGVELKVLLRTERARGEASELFRSVWRGWTREFELVASPVPARAPRDWEHYRFREEGKL